VLPRRWLRIGHVTGRFGWQARIGNVLKTPVTALDSPRHCSETIYADFA
jgi:hypothetical protein